MTRPGKCPVMVRQLQRQREPDSIGCYGDPYTGGHSTDTGFVAHDGAPVRTDYRSGPALPLRFETPGCTHAGIERACAAT